MKVFKEKCGPSFYEQINWSDLIYIGLRSFTRQFSAGLLLRFSKTSIHEKEFQRIDLNTTLLLFCEFQSLPGCMEREKTKRQRIDLLVLTRSLLNCRDLFHFLPCNNFTQTNFSQRVTTIPIWPIYSCAHQFIN